MADIAHRTARLSLLKPGWLLAGLLGILALAAVPLAPVEANRRAARELQAIMSHYAGPSTGGRVGGGREHLCASFEPPAAVSDPAHLPSRLAVENPLWAARWAFALCDRSLLEIAAAAPAGAPDSLPAIFSAYASWQLGDEDAFLAKLAGNGLVASMFRTKALDASAAHDWPQAYHNARLAYRLGAEDARLLLVYANSGLFSGESVSDAVAVLERVQAIDPTSYHPYQSLSNVYLHYTTPPDLAAARANLELACQYGLEITYCRLTRAEIAFQAGDYGLALVESSAAQASTDRSVRERGMVLEARALARLGRLSEATAAMGELVESAPDRADYIQEFLQFLLLAGEADAALSVCLDFAQRCPTCLAEASFASLLAQLPECAP